MKGIMAKRMSEEGYDDSRDRVEPPKKPATTAPTGRTAPSQEDAGAQTEPQDDIGGEPATEAEQAAYEKVVMAAMKVIYSDESHQKIMQMIQGGSRPDQALADVTTAIMLELDKQSGGKIPEVVIMPASMEVLGMLGELAEKAGLFDGNENTLTAAAQQVVLKLLEEYGADPGDIQAVIGRLDPSKVKELVAQQQGIAQGWAGEQGQAQGQPVQSPPGAQPPAMPAQGA